MKTRSSFLSLTVRLFTLSMLVSTAPGWLLYGQDLRAFYHGKVFVDRNGNGVPDENDSPRAGVAVSDGLHVVKTNGDGSFSLPGHAQARFISITTPVGFKAGLHFFQKIDSTNQAYNFALIPEERPDRTDRKVRMIHISDTETDRHGDWIYQIRDYVRNHDIDFILHNGDIAGKAGMSFHANEFNTRTMGKPVFYAVGNHDLVQGNHGEELFEELFGPTHYSFDIGSVHFVVTPMSSGDYPPSYTDHQIYTWLKNDLALKDSSQQLVFINHSYVAGNPRYSFKQDQGTINLLDHRLAAYFYGHWHSNYSFVEAASGVYNICTAPVNKGGIDNSPARFVVAEFDKNGLTKLEPRYAFIEDHIVVAPTFPKPGSIDGSDKGISFHVQAYDSRKKVTQIRLRILDPNDSTFTRIDLSRQSDWTWAGVIRPPAESNQLSGYTAEAEVHYADGKISVVRQAITNQNGSDQLQLKWIQNLKTPVWKATPVIAGDLLITASGDDLQPDQNRIYALDRATGNIRWQFKTRNTVKSRIQYSQGIVFATDAEGFAYALDALNGKLKWSKDLVGADKLPGHFTGGLVHEGVYYTGEGEYLQAIDTQTGQTIWTNMEKTGHALGTPSNMLIYEDVLITGANWVGLYGYDKNTGKLLWQQSGRGLRSRRSSGIIHEGKLYLASGRSIHIIDPLAGTLIRATDFPYDFNVMSTPAIHQGNFIVATADQGIVAFRLNELTTKWNFRAGEALIYTAPYSGPGSRSIENDIVTANNQLLAGASDGALYVIDAISGNVAEKHTLGAPVFSDAVVDSSKNLLYIADFSGNVYCFEYKAI